MFGIYKKIFIGLVKNIVNTSNHIKCVSLCNQKCSIQPTFINLHPNKICYYSFAVNLNWYILSCNTFNDLSNKISVSTKAEDYNLSNFNMIRETNKSETWK